MFAEWMWCITWDGLQCCEEVLSQNISPGRKWLRSWNVSVSEPGRRGGDLTIHSFYISVNNPCSADSTIRILSVGFESAAGPGVGYDWGGWGGGLELPGKPIDPSRLRRETWHQYTMLWIWVTRVHLWPLSPTSTTKLFVVHLTFQHLFTLPLKHVVDTCIFIWQPYLNFVSRASFLHITTPFVAWCSAVYQSGRTMLHKDFFAMRMYNFFPKIKIFV